jgi:hypothetical protein
VADTAIIVDVPVANGTPTGVGVELTVGNGIGFAGDGSVAPGIALTIGRAIKLGIATEPDVETDIVGAVGVGVGVDGCVGVVTTAGLGVDTSVPVVEIMVGPVGLETSHATPRTDRTRKAVIRVISHPQATEIPGCVLTTTRRRPSAS